MQSYLRPTLPLLIFMSLLLTNCGEDDYAFDESTAVFSNFSGQKTFEHLEKIVGIGPRIAGSEGLKKSREYIAAQLEQFGWGVQLYEFELDTQDGKITFCNIRARYSPEENAEIWNQGVSGVICSHYDTKKFTFETPFVGANDGGSSTAALLEMARVLAEKPDLARRIELVWFDGEEAFGKNITETDGLFGSKIYASEMALQPAKNRPKWGLLLDMIGDKDLKIRVGVNIEEPSLRDRKNADKKLPVIDLELMKERRSEIANQLISTAKQLGHRRAFGISPNYITDDHVPLNNIAGIPTIDIIDFDFDYWHTPGDTLDKISAESLEITGQTTLLLVEKYLLAE